ncbi:MAG: hypothetical protein IE927_12380 [Rhodobacterales bacterium]|nr:hypothetical protein [Rhodobacterales bacterium]
MSARATSTIAQLLYLRPPQLNFAHVVRELDVALARCPADRRDLTWDCEDVAVFNLDGSRIVLGYSEDLRGRYAACLTVSVGHGEEEGLTDILARRRDGLARMICDRLILRWPCDDEAWHTLDRIVTAEVVDDLLDALMQTPAQPWAAGVDEAELIDPATVDAALADDPAVIDRLMARMMAELAARDQTVVPLRPAARPAPAVADPPPAALADPEVVADPVADPVADQAAPSVAASAADPAAEPAPEPAPAVEDLATDRPRITPLSPPCARPRPRPILRMAVRPPAEAAPANDQPDLPRPRDPELERVRAALYPAEPVAAAPQDLAPLSTQMRLAVHAMNATMIVVALPVGAAMMTYSLLRGEDMRLSGRAMALTGAVLAFGNSPFAREVLALMPI